MSTSRSMPARRSRVPPWRRRCPGRSSGGRPWEDRRRSHSSSRRRPRPARAGARARSARARRPPSRAGGRGQHGDARRLRVTRERERDAAGEIGPPSSSASAPSAPRARAPRRRARRRKPGGRPRAPPPRAAAGKARDRRARRRRARRPDATCREAAPSRAPAPPTAMGTGYHRGRVYVSFPGVPATAPRLQGVRRAVRARRAALVRARSRAAGPRQRRRLRSFQPFRHVGGHSPASLPWLGALAAQTSRVLVGTSVLTPTYRYHPAVVARRSPRSAASRRGGSSSASAPARR